MTEIVGIVRSDSGMAMTMALVQGTTLYNINQLEK